MMHVTIKKFSQKTGYSENAVRSKIQRGEWLEGVLFIKAPDNRILMNLEGYEKWATTNARRGRSSRLEV